MGDVEDGTGHENDSRSMHRMEGRRQIMGAGSGDWEMLRCEALVNDKTKA